MSPAYDYKCPNCGTTKEVTHGMNELPIVRCPRCYGTPRMRKVPGVAGIRFVGPGFHKNDYPSKTVLDPTLVGGLKNAERLQKRLDKDRPS